MKKIMMRNIGTDLLNNKKTIKKNIRYALLACGIIIALLGAFFVFIGNKKETVVKENAIFSYNLNVDSAYRVYLKENNLFMDDYLEEGLAYSERLTDHIWVNLRSALIGSADANITGNYTIDAVLEGYQNGKVINKIYEKKYHIKDAQIEPGMKEAKIDESVDIKPEEYKLDVMDAEDQLGGTTDKRFYLLFEGDYNINIGTRSESQHFSYELPIPISTQTVFYVVEKPEAVNQNEKIVETVTELVRADKKNIFIGIFCLLIGIGSVLTLLLLTRIPSEDELIKIDVRDQIRKNGSRFIHLEVLPDIAGRDVLEMNDMDDMIMLAEELHQPILYSVREDGLPQDGRFIIDTDKYVYTIRYNI